MEHMVWLHAAEMALVSLDWAFNFIDCIFGLDVCNFKQQTWRFQQIEIGIRHKCGCAKEKYVNLFKSYSTVSISAAAFGNSAEKEKKVESAGCVLNGMQREFNDPSPLGHQNLHPAGSVAGNFQI